MSDALRVTTAYCTRPEDWPWYDLNKPNLLHVVLESGAELDLEISNATWETMMNSFFTVVRKDIAAALADPEFTAVLAEKMPWLRRWAEERFGAGGWPT